MFRGLRTNARSVRKKKLTKLTCIESSLLSSKHGLLAEYEHDFIVSDLPVDFFPTQKSGKFQNVCTSTGVKRMLDGKILVLPGRYFLPQ